MAQFYTDFSGETVGNPPSEFSLIFGDLTFQIQSGNELAGSDRSLLIQYASGSYERSALAYNSVTTSGTTTVRIRARFQTSTNSTPSPIVGAFLSGGGTDDVTRTGYVQWHRESDYALSKYDNGTETSEATTALDVPDGETDTWYLEILRNAGLIELRSWREGTETRPATPTISYTDPSPLAVSGSLGISALMPSTAMNNDVVVYEVAVGTDGDPVPTGVVSTPGVTAKTLERLGVAVSATAADVFVWSGHDVDMDTASVAHKVLGATITSGVLQEIDLSSTGIAVSGNITVVVVPATGGPGIAIETTAEDIA